MKMISPLRYPGGKSILYNKVKRIIEDHNLQNKTYTEPFAGGFGIGIKLMTNNIVNKFIINDYDYHIYAFWKVLFSKSNQLINFIKNVDVCIEVWEKQKSIYNDYKNYSIIEVACSTFFLNRTNYSGVLKGGPIGGKMQLGEYKINCRFNKEKLIKMIEKIASYKSNVEIYNYDAVKLIEKMSKRQNELFINFDPPYVKKGKELYKNFYTVEDHIQLEETISKCLSEKWIMTYDDNQLINDTYKKYYIQEYNLSYFAGKKKKGTELLISNFKI